MSLKKQPTDRFSHTVENYQKYRPGYPEELVDLIKETSELDATKTVADLGSGTGILTALLLKTKAQVFAVEPNALMREAAEKALSHYKNFISVDGSGEATTLPEHSVDAITVATAFHWFDADKAKVEFKRILKPGSYCYIIWNYRDENASPLMAGYEALLKEFGTDYKAVHSGNFKQSDIEAFYAPCPCHTKRWTYKQRFDYEGLKGRLLSTSYALEKGDARFEEMLDALKTLFEQHQKEGYIDFIYRSVCYFTQFN